MDDIQAIEQAASPVLMAAASHEILFELFMELLEPLGDEVDVVLETSRRSFAVLDQPYTSNADGRIRKLFVFTSMIRGDGR